MKNKQNVFCYDENIALLVERCVLMWSCGRLYCLCIPRMQPTPPLSAENKFAGGHFDRGCVSVLATENNNTFLYSNWWILILKNMVRKVKPIRSQNRKNV